MQKNSHFTRYKQQANGTFSSLSTSLTQRPTSWLPLKGTFYADVHQHARLMYSTSFTTPPTSSPVTHDDFTKDEQSVIAKPEPGHYTLDDGLRNAPGTTAYYKSWAFRKKVHEGSAQVPGQENEAGEDTEDTADEDYNKNPKRTDRAKSLIMIFSMKNVRRANADRKADKRMQRANRRMKSLRKIEGLRRLFKWE